MRFFFASFETFFLMIFFAYICTNTHGDIHFTCFILKKQYLHTLQYIMCFHFVLYTFNFYRNSHTKIIYKNRAKWFLLNAIKIIFFLINLKRKILTLLVVTSCVRRYRKIEENWNTNFIERHRYAWLCVRIIGQCVVCRVLKSIDSV